jgi:Zn-dependent peptidase ImmA (M78 family)
MRIPAEIKAVIDHHQRCFPVDVSAVARDLGVLIFSTPLPNGISGVLLRDASFGSKSGFVIHVDRNEPSVRQRFTAAHELGHFVLHKNFIGDRVEDNYLLRSTGMSNSQETEANAFAADLLMPQHLISRALESGTVTVESLARKFHVSQTAMSIRLGMPT